MNAYWRAKWKATRMGRKGYRTIRSRLRSITPSWLRHPLSNLIADRENAEKPLTDCSFPPPQKYDVVCFPIIDWDLRFQRPQHLLTQFALNGHRAFYLHTTFHQAGRDPLIRMIGPNLYRVRLPGPPEPDALYRKALNPSLDEAWLGALDALSRGAGIEAAVSLVEFPNWSGLADSCRRSRGWKIVYDCLDEHTGFSNISPGILAREVELIEGSDIVVATSRLLYEKVRSKARRALLLPNAADYDHFKDPGAARPLRGISRPIIGYFGAIAEWFDVELVATAARRRKDWQFVLIGSTHGADLSSVSRLRNVNLLGELPYAELPGYLHQFDAAIIPFRLTPLTAATNPVKFYEYLSAGKPVVSVRLPELEPFEDLYYPAGTGAEFVLQIEAALSERSPEKAEARREIARANTWRHRYEQLSDAIRSI